MSSVFPRPADAITEDYLLLGLPVVEFGYELSSGGFGAYFGLGVLSSVELQKTLQSADLRSSHSGSSKLLRRIVRQFDASFEVGCFRHSGANMQLMFGSATLSEVSASQVSITDDPFRLTTDDQTFHDLANQQLVEPITGVECDLIEDEEVGVGDGTTGDGAGDFALDFKPLNHDDVTIVTVAGTAYSVVAVGAAAAGLEVEVTDFGDSQANAGYLQFFSGGVATNVTGQILATYRPTHSFVENTDFAVDYLAGRVRLFSHDQTADPLKDNQPMRADYDYDRPQYEEIEPFTQFTFAGRARIRQLPDVTSNLVWYVPKAEILLTEDAFTFNRDDLTVTNLSLNLLEDDADLTQPYGYIRVYREGTF